MKHFMIKYQFANAPRKNGHREVRNFIAALDGDPELKERSVVPRHEERDDASYFHLAAAPDEAVKTLQSRDFFKHLYGKDKAVAAGGEVTVTPIELIGETV